MLNNVENGKRTFAAFAMGTVFSTRTSSVEVV
jgi:hypothetical protein